MSGQLIISLGREFGSGGHEIARALAERFQLPLYEENILLKIAQERGVNVRNLARYDELPRNRLLYRTVNGFSNAPGDIIAQMQFDYLKERASSGESFVVVGRCSEEILRDYPGLVSIFVGADRDFKLARTMAREPISEDEALILMAKKDKKRKNYHNQFCKGKWGDCRNYDIALNSSRLGIGGTINFLEIYIRARMRKWEKDAKQSNQFE